MGWQKSQAGWSRVGKWLVCGSVCCAFGCSSSERESQKPVSEQCRDYQSHYCAKAAECAQSTDRTDYADTCNFALQVYLQCDLVTETLGVQDCLTSIDAINCDTVDAGTFPDYPEDCRGILLR